MKPRKIRQRNIRRINKEVPVDLLDWQTMRPHSEHPIKNNPLLQDVVQDIVDLVVYLDLLLLHP